MPRNPLSEFEKHLRKEIAQSLKKHTINITQKQLSEMTGIPSSTISGYFAERSTIKAGNTQKIADALNIDKSDIDPRFKDKVFEKEHAFISEPSSIIEPERRSSCENNNYDSYVFYDTGISAGIPDSVKGYTDDYQETITLSDHVMGRYAGDYDIFVTRTNGHSMNNVFPHDSLIAVKPTNIFDLNDGDIVVFRIDCDLCAKRYYNDKENERIIFKPDSKYNTFTDVVVPYEETASLQIYGRVVVYIVNL
ncbi:XRE family transcriptional regulator [Bacillus mycoides]|uniref:LexA family transcriptional regulator n=1 Tax=Bacillus mycoides TaxID=1405 RepID=UPI002E247D3C|nr:XRE family transcriptional regulator [Bacillus mycoides]